LQTNLAELLQSRQSFLLTGHENPDGDCVGAQCALYHLLVAMGKQVTILNPDPISRSYDFLLRHTPFHSARDGGPVPTVEVVVLLDCSQLSRVGELGKRLAATGAILAVIDHHVGSEHGDGQVGLVDATAAATGALVRRLYAQMGRPLSAAAAEGVFLSLVSDTGWFRYSNTDASVMAMAGEMIDSGVQPALVYDAIHRRNHPDSAKLLADALGTGELRLGGRLAVACLDKSIMDRAGRIDFDTDQVLDPLRSLQEVEVVALFKERFDGSVKLSMRAKGDVDVQQIAAAFGGGGHKKAAGATLQIPMPAAVHAVEQHVARALASKVP
jgi:phosphoesterase RecJ-like protein